MVSLVLDRLSRKYFVPRWTGRQLEMEVWSSRQMFRLEIKIGETSSPC